MAAEIEDDDAWLYGDSKKEGGAESPQGDAETLHSNGNQLSVDAPEFEPKEKYGDEGDVEDMDEEKPRLASTGEGDDEDAAPPDMEHQEEDDDDDDSDDDVQITIGDIKSGPLDGPRLFKPGTYQRPQVAAAQPIKKPTEAKGLDVDVPGAINGIQIYEFDLETVQEKPWLKPGADLTDYFNYGFNEESWKKYCSKQRSLRLEYNPASLPKQMLPHPVTMGTGSSITVDVTKTPPSAVKSDENKSPATSTSIASISGGSSSLSFGRRAGPPPLRRYHGTIDVIGSTQRDSRRPHKDYSSNSITVAGDSDYNSQYNQQSVPSSLPPAPDFQSPPPTMPPTPVPPPPDYSRPPPNMAPVSYPNHNFYPPPGPGVGPPPTGPPPASYDYYNQPPPTSYPPPHPQFNTGPPPRGPWDGRPEDRGSPPRNWEYGGGRSPSPDFSSSDSDKEFKYREHYRSRSRSRERDRSDRRHKEHKKRKSDEDDAHKKHKKSKRSKRD